MHLVSEIWEAVERGELPPRFLLDLAKEHFGGLCSTCAAELRRFEERSGGERSMA